MFYVYKQTNHFIAGNRMVFSPVFGLSSYDFVNNTAPLEYGYSAFSIFGSWINYSSNGALFYDNAAKPFVCDPNTLDISSLSSYYKVQNTSYPMFLQPEVRAMICNIIICTMAIQTKPSCS